MGPSWTTVPSASTRRRAGRSGPESRTPIARPAEHALRPALGVAAGHDRIPAGAGEQRQPAVHRDEVDGAGIAGRQRGGQELRARASGPGGAPWRCRIPPGCSRAPCPCPPPRCNRRPGCRPRPPPRSWRIQPALSANHDVSVSGSRVATVWRSAPRRCCASVHRLLDARRPGGAGQLVQEDGDRGRGVTTPLYAPAPAAAARLAAAADRLGQAGQHLGGVVLVGRWPRRPAGHR